MKAFEFSRFLKFTRFEWLSRFSDQMLPLLVPTMLYSLWALGSLLNGGVVDGWGSGSFSFGLMLGISAAANAHRMENNQSTAVFHLLLPATHCEKFFGKWMLSFGLCFFGQALWLTILANAFALIGAIKGGSIPSPLLPESNQLSSELEMYLVTHSVFFAGGVFFKRNVIIKTILSSTAFAAAAGLVVLVLVSAGVIPRSTFTLERLIEFQGAGSGSSFGKRVFHVAWFYVLPVFLYAAAYRRSGRNEARG
jgi:hypothetical protein